MSSEAMPSITYLFPADAPDFFDSLKLLLKDLPNATVTNNEVTIAASHPADSLPVTIFKTTDAGSPQVYFDLKNLVPLQVGRLGINTSSIDQTRLQAGQKDTLPLADIYARLKGHLVRLDHTGVNIPSALVPKKSWEQFIHSLSTSSAMYRYPTGEDWPFILPATTDEFEADITEFPAGREPKIELVYDHFSKTPTIQIDIETNLTRQDVERLFPDPIGISFPDLADYFRTVYVQHEWPGLQIRFDIRFKNDNPVNDWNTGKWLVTEGGRI